MTRDLTLEYLKKHPEVIERVATQRVELLGEVIKLRQDLKRVEHCPHCSCSCDRCKHKDG